MMNQRKIAQNVGKDTHVRQSMGNRFKEQGSKTFQMLAGEVLITEPEPLFKQNMVTIGMARGGTVTSVAYPGAFIDPISGNLHGSYEGPIPGQMVMVGYENGNASSPFVVNRYPYQGKGNTLVENKYINPLTQKGFDATDVIMGHFSGSYLSFNTGILSGELPGSVTLASITGFSIKSATQDFKTLIDALLDILRDFSTAGSPVAHTTDAATKAKIAVEKAKWALLVH
jgi:hypothetical protein